MKQEAIYADAAETKELTDALQRVISDHARRLVAANRQPTINAVAYALATVTGAMLASLEDRAHRRMMRRAIDQTIERSIEVNRTSNFARVLRPGDFRQ